MARKSRFDLHDELCALLNSNHVYFQPPESIKLVYPCIIYDLSRIDTIHADDAVYKYDKAYEVTIITKDPDTPLPEFMLTHFEMCRFNRYFVNDNLHHYVFVIYY